MCRVLLAMPYLGDVNVNDPIYQNTRRFVWSEDNPYFFKGKAGEGIGGPHIGYDMVWPMSIMMKAFTSQNDAEIKTCIKMLMDTDAVPVLCTNLSIRTIRRNLPVHGLPGRILFSVS